jgi:hypothetical protein
MSHRVPAVVAPFVLVLASAANAGVLWNETVSGDLSDNWLVPSPVALGAGSNTLSGTTGERDDGSIDRDYFVMTIPAGVVLTQILLVDYFSNDQVAFIGVQGGTVMPDPNIVTADSLLGWALFGPSAVGSDLLDELSVPRYPGGGFIPPVAGPATFTFWVQQTGEATLYEIDFVAVPTPGAAGVLAGGLILGARRRRR